MRKIGITGGVGSGKSQVLEYLEKVHHARICQADLVAHELQKPGNLCWTRIIAYFGADICSMDGTIDRKKLGAIVFSDDRKLKALNAMIHPAVNERIRDMIAEEEARGTSLFILEAALMTEEIYREMLDEIWYIYTNENVRRERLRRSRDYSDEKIDAMMAAQVSEKMYRDFCDLQIDNNGSFEETQMQIDRILNLTIEDNRR